MNETLERDSFEERLLPMLKDGVQYTSLGRNVMGTPSGRRRFTKGRIFIVLAAALTVLAGSLFAGSALGGRQIVKVDGLRALRDPAAVESELRDAGIDATIVEVPVPSGVDDNQGYWWWITVDRPEQLTQEEFAQLYAQVGFAQVGLGDGIQGVISRTLELPKMPGHVTLFVGREVPAGQFTVFQYDRMNELSPVGAFYCLGIDPNEPAALGAALEARGYRIIWNLESNNRNYDETAPPANTVATWAWLRGPQLVDIRLAPAGTPAERQWAAKYQSAEGTFPLGETPPWAPHCP
jgi:hypothetical protein